MTYLILRILGYAISGAVVGSTLMSYNEETYELTLHLENIMKAGAALYQGAGLAGIAATFGLSRFAKVR